MGRWRASSVARPTRSPIGRAASRAISAVVPICLWGGLLAGCASAVPEILRHPTGTEVSVAQVQEDPTPWLGRTLRWGGTLISVQNRARGTDLELLAKPLGHDGEPLGDSTGEGRFLVESSRFLDPAEYSKGRSLTVFGTLLRVETRPVGEYPYRYPVLAGDTLYLWPESLQPVVWPYPWPWPYPWYGPPYGPLYGPRFGPFWGPPW
jgi:outer membrane lipoprotein